MIRSALSYARQVALAMTDARTRALIVSHTDGLKHGAGDHRLALEDATGYLLRAQRQGTDAGLGSYHLTEGWGASYPETTGYAIPTLLSAGDRLGPGVP